MYNEVSKSDNLQIGTFSRSLIEVPLKLMNNAASKVSTIYMFLSYSWLMFNNQVLT